jgi:uncharacterized protein (DUF433 family)
MSTVDILDRDVYSEAEAARLLGVAQGTLHYWLEGGSGQRPGKDYRPIIRTAPRGERVVTWAEFVEAALLRQYRHIHGVRMAELRTFIELLRERFDVPYPLAHKRPFVSGRRLIYDAQDLIGLDADFCLVSVANNQLLLTPPAQSFIDRVTWDGDIAAGWRPHDDPKSPVRMDPKIRFGRPAIRGISTEALWEYAQDGATEEEIAQDFDLSDDDVGWALSYERSRRTAA